MDVTSLTSLPRGNSIEKHQRDEYTDQKHRADLLRKSLSQIKQLMTEQQENRSASSIEAAAKMALAESYINSGKFFAAEQVIKEISENTSTQDLTIIEDDDVYIKTEETSRFEELKDESKAMEIGSNLDNKAFDPNILLNLEEEEKAEESLRLLTNEISDQVGETLSTLRSVISGFYGLSESNNPEKR